MAADKKGFKWDGKSRISNDTYRKNFNKIFKTKEKEQNDVRQGCKRPSQNDR
jgi:hypothetical protein